MNDLVILVADKDMKRVLEQLLRERYNSLGCRCLRFQVISHPEHDAACYRECHKILKPFQKSYSFALMLVDRDGCHKHKLSRRELEKDIEERLFSSGWEKRSAAIVLDPELEIWVWNDSPHVDIVLGWKDRKPNLRLWLHQKGFEFDSNGKPLQPKKAMEEALKNVNKHWSSEFHKDLAAQVGLSKCVDESFLKLKSVLQTWFPIKRYE